jgi:signal peptidase I
MTKAKPVEKKKRTKNVFREYFELIAETAVFVFFVMTFVVQAFQIPTGSMDPTLLVGDFLLVNKFVYDNGTPPIDQALLPRRDIKRKDIIVFKYPNVLSTDYVKRVIGLPGEKLEIRNKQVFINDQPLDEPYKVHRDARVRVKNESYDYEDTIRDNFGPVTVPPGHLFAMGDNRDDSQDSRYWGFVPLNYVKGRPWITYFSYEAERDAYQKTSVRDRLKKLVQFISKARLKRMLKIIR